MADVNDYLSLIPSENSDKPNFVAVLSGTLKPFVDGINQLNALPSLFDIDNASGDQLDAVGQWVGLSRRLSLVIDDVYFAFDTPGLGFDEGVWFSQGQPSEGIVTLDDSTYRVMLKAKIAANEWDGSLGDANRRLLEVFPGADVILKDNFDMSETFIISGTPYSVLFQKLVEQGFLDFKPAAVNVT